MSTVAEALNLPDLNAAFETADPAKIVAWAVTQFGDELVMSSSFGAESACLLHMATRPVLIVPRSDTPTQAAKTAAAETAAGER